MNELIEETTTSGLHIKLEEFTDIELEVPVMSLCRITVTDVDTGMQVGTAVRPDRITGRVTYQKFVEMTRNELLTRFS